ncbi:MAG: hypothetical protein JWN14_2227 [Chthonomonadales bacterium]|nr:hypothetical protein [Chthonomonadales bacterium]
MDDGDLLSETPPTLSSLTRTIQQHHWLNRMVPVIWVVAFAATGGVLIAADRYLLPGILNRAPETLGEFILAIFVCVLGIPLEITQRRCRKSLEKLFSTSDVRMTPLLFELLFEIFGSDSSDGNRQKVEEFHVQTRTALMRLLPEIRQEHAFLFDNRSRALWRRLLHRVPANVKDTEFIIQVLKVMAVLGDEQDLGVVAMIADGRAARSWPLKQAACDCVAAIQERLKQQEAQTSLLRPADHEDLLKQTLLRPHHTRAASSPEQLLRAHYSQP